jgi:hypothetical protein
LPAMERQFQRARMRLSTTNNDLPIFRTFS